MRLLICTQTVDRADPQLGFFHQWLEQLARKTEILTVISLSAGGYVLPANVYVHSLGKERGAPFMRKVVYAVRFLWFIWRLRGTYDAVFVHMNQEYVLLAGLFWKLRGKPVYLWRNHYKGSPLTDLAAAFCTKVFYTSRASYTATYSHAVRMPVGIDVSSLNLEVPIERRPRSILFLARLDQSKRPHLLLEALGLLHARGISFNATIAGGPSGRETGYPERLKSQAERLGVAAQVAFVGPVPNPETFRYYRSHEVFVNCSRSGMFDKTLFKAVASGCIVLASSDDFKDLAGETFVFNDNDVSDLARKIEAVLAYTPDERQKNVEALQRVITNNTLAVLVKRLGEEMRLS